MFEMLTREKKREIIKLNLENAVNYLIKEQNYNLCGKTAKQGENDGQYCIYYTKDNNIILAERKDNAVYPVSQFRRADKLEFIIDKIDGNDKIYIEGDVNEIDSILLACKSFRDNKNVNYKTIAGIINHAKQGWS